MKIEWQLIAEQDLLEIVQYIAAENPQAAYQIFDEIKGQISLLEDHPQLGRIGRVNGTRELIIIRTPYLVAYRIIGDVVNILRVTHGARKWPGLKNQKK
ncbi:MAG: type II toxin-antitoxin system RelE/ParE family toxin [Legionellales bacterium]|jgi:toxin ParE1/3/4